MSVILQLTHTQLITVHVCSGSVDDPERREQQAGAERQVGRGRRGGLEWDGETERGSEGLKV